MTLRSGMTLAHYRLDRKIGAGGMGEVWRAIDTALDRAVAIKILPDIFAADPERLARFEREAKLLAGLHHPGIAVIHGLHREGSVPFLAMELVEGEDLARRLARCPLPVDEAIAVARQVAEALAAAHESGVVHRDLKPANIQVAPDGAVKVLDFGLAKALEAEPSSAAASLSPTITAAATRAGVVLGTAAYMSPEQARGRSVDRRADIWAFGCVLYEMLTGRAVFGGETVSDTIAAVLRSDPDWGLLPAATPASVVRLLRRCLVRDPKERQRDIGDAALDLAEAEGGEGAPAAGVAPAGATAAAARPRRGAAWAWAAAGIAAGALAVFAAQRAAAPAAAPSGVRRFSIPVPQLTTGFQYAPRISPDGRAVAYAGRAKLWVRDMQRFEPVEIPGSDGASSPFWSPDGTRIGFVKNRKLLTWALAGGQTTTACDLPEGGDSFNHAAWGPDGRIYFAAWRGGIYEVAAAGGTPRRIIAPADNEVDFHHPMLLPDGRHLVAVAHRKTGPKPVVLIALPGGERRDLRSLDDLEAVSYSPTGHLLLTFNRRPQRILAVPFSEAKLKMMGDPFLVAMGGQYPSVAATGTMAYYLGAAYAERELVWVDHAGRAAQAIGGPQPGLDMPSLSPDGRRAAVVAFEKDNADIWVHDLARGTRSRLVAGPEEESLPFWSPSGDRVFYQVQENVYSNLMEIAADGTGTPRLRARGVVTDAIAITPDGRTAVFGLEKAGSVSLVRLALDADAAAVPLNANPAVQEQYPAISPDGDWLAYVSDEAGPLQVFVRRFPDGGHKQQVSLNGGTYPFWGRDGRSLLYWQADALMEVPLQRGTDLAPGTVHLLFTASDIDLAPSDLAVRPALDVDANGRFLFVRRSAEDPRRGILMVENWFEEFRAP